MAKWANDNVMDLGLNWLKANAKKICCCSQTPTTYAEAVSTYKLAYTNISGADFTGPADGDASGRKLTVGQKLAVPVSTTGSSEVFALVDTSGSGSLLYVTNVSGVQTLTAGNTMTFNAWDIELADPS